MAGLLDFIRDKESQKAISSGLLDAANRGAVAGLLGGPVDLMTMAMRPFGYSTEKPVMGSEWIGQKMQDAGLVSENRNPVAEALAGFALPAAAYAAGPKLYAAEQAIRQNASAPTLLNTSTRNQAGMLKIGRDLLDIPEKGPALPTGLRTTKLPDGHPMSKYGERVPVQVVPDDSIQRLSGMQFGVTPDGVAELRVSPSLMRDRDFLRARSFRSIDDWMWPFSDDVFIRGAHSPDDWSYLSKGLHRGSKNHATNELEGGLSVARNLEPAGYKNAYFVRGKQIGVGSDSEPLLEMATAKPIGNVFRADQVEQAILGAKKKRLSDMGISEAQARWLRTAIDLNFPR